MLLHERSKHPSLCLRGRFLPSSSSLSVNALCPSIREELWMSVCPSASSALSQSSHFYYPNHISHLLSDPLLLDDQPPSRTRGKLSFLHHRSWGSRLDEGHNPLIPILHSTHFTQCLRFFIEKEKCRISQFPSLALPSGFWYHWGVSATDGLSLKDSLGLSHFSMSQK